MDITDLLERATATAQPDVSALVRGGLARGRRRRLRRRLAYAGSTAVVVAALAAVGVALVPKDAADTRRAPVTVGGSSDSSTAAAPSVTSTPPVTVVLTPQALLQTALDLLPPTAHTSHYAGRAGAGYVFAELVYDDGHGPAKLDVGLEYGASTETGTQFCHDVGCTPAADGTVLWSHAGYEYPADPGRGAREWNADYFRADGVHVSVSEWNSSAEKDAAITRAAPPLTLAELRTFVSSDRWQPQVDAARDAAAESLFTPDPSPDGTDPAAQKKQQVRTHAASDQRKAAQLRHECALAKQTHKTPPAYCATLPGN